MFVARATRVSGFALFCFIGAAGAHVIRVPQNVPTIQQGLDRLSSGDTVLVSPGVYSEELVAPPLVFTLLGDVPVDTGDFPRPVIYSNNLWALHLPFGSDATVERIRFRCHTTVGRGIHLYSGHATIRDCAFDSTRGAVVVDNDALSGSVDIESCVFRYWHSFVQVWPLALHAHDCLFRGVLSIWNANGGDSSVVEDCVFIDAAVSAITTWGQPWEIRHCIFASDTGRTGYAYVDLANAFSGVFEENLFWPLRLGARALDMDANCDAEAIIRGNVFHDCLPAPDWGYPPTLMLLSCDSGDTRPYLVIENEMYACSTRGLATAILAEGRGYFERNRIHNLVPAGTTNPPAVKLQSGDSMIFRENLFYGNGFALDAGSVPVADARWNWWGDMTGPRSLTNPQGLGDSVGATIRYEPWYPDTSFLPVPGLGQPLPQAFVFEAYPNPFNSTVHLTLIPAEVGIVKVELFDVLGRKTQEIWHGPLAYQKELTFEANALASGIYFARVTDVISRKNLAMAKLVLLK